MPAFRYWPWEFALSFPQKAFTLPYCLFSLLSRTTTSCLVLDILNPKRIHCTWLSESYLSGYEALSRRQCSSHGQRLDRMGSGGQRFRDRAHTGLREAQKKKIALNRPINDAQLIKTYPQRRLDCWCDAEKHYSDCDKLVLPRPRKRKGKEAIQWIVSWIKWNDQKLWHFKLNCGDSMR